MYLLSPRLLARLHPQNGTLVHEESVVPSRHPRARRCLYAPQYRWLFLFERRLATKLTEWLPESRDELFGTNGLISEALSNAYCHGNGRDPDRPIWVRLYEGPCGLMLEIEDSGRGFDHRRLLRQAAKGHPTYFRNAGNGLRCMIENPHFGVWFDRGGRVLRIVRLEDAEEIQPRCSVADA